MREEIENPMIKEPAAQLNIGYYASLQREMVPNLDKYIKMWEEMERRERLHAGTVGSDRTGSKQA